MITRLLSQKLVLLVIGLAAGSGILAPAGYASFHPVTSDEIEDGTIQSVDIGTGQVTNSDIAANAVSTSKIGTGAVTNSDIAANAVTTGKILDGSVKSPDLASNSVDSSKIVDGAVTPPKLADGITAISKVSGPASTITLTPTLQDIVSTSVSISTDSEMALVLDMTLESGGFTLQSGSVQIALSSTGSADLTVVGGDTISWSSDTGVPPHHIVIATGVSPTGETVTITVRANDTSPSGPTETFVPANETHLLVIALPS